MIIFTLRDLGKGFNPWNLNNKNDVVGHQQPEEFRVVFGDGTVTALPPETTIAQDISDDGVVLVTLGSAQPTLVEIATSTVEPISIPGFPALQVNALSYKGDLVGSAGRSQFITDDWRGFVMNGKTKAITWIFPMMVSLPPGATPFLELSDLNNKGHASGRQGWVRGPEQVEVPIFYNGTTIVQIGAPAFISSAGRITESDRIRVWYHPVPAPDYEGLYEGATGVLSPFLSGSILDVNTLGWILWRDTSASWDYYLTNGTTKKLDQLLPAGSGWSNLSAIRMNDNGSIIGYGWLAGEPHGYMLTPTYDIDVRETLVAQILWGIVNDAGGVFILGGRRHPVPPWGPLRELLAALPHELREELVAVISRARLDGPASAQAFGSQIRGIVARYQQQNRRS